MRTFLLLIAGAALATAGPAQVASTVGPPVAPVGCPISIAISNDSPAQVGTGICPYLVEDTAGRPVYVPICPAILRLVEPGETFSTLWPQVDNNGRPVPPGDYAVTVTLPGGAIQQHTVTIDATARGGVATVGVVRLGTARRLYACSPRTPNDLYVMAASASGTAPGVALCGGTLPLNLDPLLLASLQPNPVLLDFQGLLDGSGTTTDPAIALPPIAALAGVSFHVAFVAAPRGQPCPLTVFSEPLRITVNL
ncbi:MAG: hypothetical protein AAF628_37285 [Planctomycetota bacterium]